MATLAETVEWAREFKQASTGIKYMWIVGVLEQFHQNRWDKADLTSDMLSAASDDFELIETTEERLTRELGEARAENAKLLSEIEHSAAAKANRAFAQENAKLRAELDAAVEHAQSLIDQRTTLRGHVEKLRGFADWCNNCYMPPSVAALVNRSADVLKATEPTP